MSRCDRSRRHIFPRSHRKVSDDPWRQTGQQSTSSSRRAWAGRRTIDPNGTIPQLKITHAPQQASSPQCAVSRARAERIAVGAIRWSYRCLAHVRAAVNDLFEFGSV